MLVHSEKNVGDGTMKKEMRTRDILLAVDDGVTGVPMTVMEDRLPDLNRPAFARSVAA